MSRERSQTAWLEAVESEAHSIIEEFGMFLDGTRVFILLHRKKDGGNTSEYKRRKGVEIVHQCESEIGRRKVREALEKLLIMKATAADTEYRIYMSGSPRDLGKAEMQFKTDMLQVDFSGGENKQYFYEHLQEKWVSALMASNPPKGEMIFVVDVDTKDNSGALRWLSDNGVHIHKQYATKNGWHMVVMPFDRTKFPAELGEVKRDGLLLLSY